MLADAKNDSCMIIEASTPARSHGVILQLKVDFLAPVETQQQQQRMAIGHVQRTQWRHER